MTRLIDANELKKQLDRTCDFQDLYLPYEFEELIDNAPTADDWQKYSDELWKNAYKEGYKQAILDGKTNFSRPQGEWIRKVDDVGFISHICSECGAEIEVEDCSDDKFCFNCGAEMGKGVKNDTFN